MTDLKDNSQQSFVALENIKQQFRQDCVLNFKGFVFYASHSLIASCALRQPIDIEGFPAPIFAQEDLSRLQEMLTTRYENARLSYFKRVAALQLENYTVKIEGSNEHYE